MTLAISLLKNFFPLDTNSQVNRLTYPKFATLNVVMYIIFPFDEVTYVDEWNQICP